MRIAVVTPYYKEEREVLSRCINSVRAQSVLVDHILVADGYPQDWVEEHSNINHIVLKLNSSDFGDTPRSVGFLVAMRNDYDVIQFLDADNMLLPEHFISVIDLFKTSGADVLIARRFLMRPDGSRLDVVFEEDRHLKHVDTSCFIFYRTAFHIALKWAFIPKQLGFIDDRIFYEAMKKLSPKIAVMENLTVGYACFWSNVYKTLGEPIPPGCRNLYPHMEKAIRWWQELTPERRNLIEANLGISITIS